jgi:hypothetical protein
LSELNAEVGMRNADLLAGFKVQRSEVQGFSIADFEFQISD